MARTRRTWLSGPEAYPAAYDAPPGGSTAQLRSDHGLIADVLPAGRAGRGARAVLREALEAAGVCESGIADAELAVGELAANADTHSRGPYEIRILLAGGHPVWCEVIDADENLAGIPEMFAKLRLNAPASDAVHIEEPPQENGHGLMIVHQLSGGRCGAFQTVMHTTGLPGKAVGFALPGSAPRQGQGPSQGGAL